MGLPLEGSRKSMVKVIQAAAPERVCDRRGKWHPVGTCAKQMGSVSLPDLPRCLSSSTPRFHLHSRLMPDKMQGEEAVKNCCRHCLYNAAAQTSKNHWSQSCLHCSWQEQLSSWLASRYTLSLHPHKTSKTSWALMPHGYKVLLSGSGWFVPNLKCSGFSMLTRHKRGWRGINGGDASQQA